MESESDSYLKTNCLKKKMMAAKTSIFNKDIFINKPPSFDGESFELWKSRFETFIKANNFEMWDFFNQ